MKDNIFKRLFSSLKAFNILLTPSWETNIDIFQKNLSFIWRFFQALLLSNICLFYFRAQKHWCWESIQSLFSFMAAYYFCQTQVINFLSRSLKPFNSLLLCRIIWRIEINYAENFLFTSQFLKKPHKGEEKLSFWSRMDNSERLICITIESLQWTFLSISLLVYRLCDIKVLQDRHTFREKMWPKLERHDLHFSHPAKMLRKIIPYKPINMQINLSIFRRTFFWQLRQTLEKWKVKEKNWQSAQKEDKPEKEESLMNERNFLTTLKKEEKYWW